MASIAVRYIRRPGRVGRNRTSTIGAKRSILPRTRSLTRTSAELVIIKRLDRPGSVPRPLNSDPHPIRVECFGHCLSSREGLPIPREGRLSYPKVRALTRVAGPGNESALLEFALHTTAARTLPQTRRKAGRLHSDDSYNSFQRTDIGRISRIQRQTVCCRGSDDEQVGHSRTA